MNSFDFSILKFCNEIGERYPAFDSLAVFVCERPLLKGGVMACLLWWAWFKQRGQPGDKTAREAVVASILTSGVAVILARLIVLALPFRVRPIYDVTSGLHFPPPTFDWVEWSSFPSDHAILYFALSICLFLISKPLGWIALLDTVFIVCLPRIYLGIHHPTDILAGAAIGVGVGALGGNTRLTASLSKRALEWEQQHPSSFYVSFFLFTYELTRHFHDLIALAKWCLHIIR